MEKTFVDTLQKFEQKIQKIIEQNKIPLMFLDLDSTITESFGSPLIDEIAGELRECHRAHCLLGLNTGADLSGVGQRVLKTMGEFFCLPIIILETGKKILAWNEAMGAYFEAHLNSRNDHDKGGSMIEITYLYKKISAPDLIYVADFPGNCEKNQPGIDDSVLTCPVGIVIAQGRHRWPDTIRAHKDTFLIKPLHLKPPWIGPTATLQYIKSFRRTMEKNQSKVIALRQDLLSSLQNVMPQDIASDSNPAIWTLDRQINYAEKKQPILIRADGPGIVHAGTQLGGGWTNVHDVPLKLNKKTGYWEALMLLRNVNIFTFLWYDQAGYNARWEGKNFSVKREFN